VEVFTTRPDTLFGAKFVAIAPDHPLATAAAKNNPKLTEFVAECKRRGTAQADIDTAEKMGFDTGIKSRASARSDLDASDLRREFRADGIWNRCDLRLPRARFSATLDFVNKYHLGNTPVVCPPGVNPKSFVITDTAYDGDGTMINSRFLDGMTIDQAKEEVAKRLESTALGKSQCRATSGQLPPAGLGYFAPALLGLSDPNHPLSKMRRSRCAR